MAIVKQKCYYQTPAMRATSPDYALPGTLIPTGPNFAIQMPDGRYLTVLWDGKDSSNDNIFDQETFLPPIDNAENNWMVMVADRMTYEAHKSYFVSVVKVA